MEDEIKKTVAHIKVTFACFWAFPILFVAFGEVENDWVGMYAGNVSVTYMAETITILLAALCVPLSLKFFSWGMTRKIDAAAFPKALKLYARWSDVRLLMLAVPVVAGLFTYYAMLSTAGVFCAVIALTASLFCLPGEGRLRREMHIDK